MAKIGDKIGPYTLEKFLGRGGFGEVWLADNPQDLLYQKVAIKLARSEDITLDMIKSEALLWRSVSGNENIIPFIEAKNYDGQIIIVSEFADDGSLQDYLTKMGGKIGISESELILQDILKGLEHLHSKGIGHFDLKPANILIKEGKFCLADFGLSKILVTENTSKGAGTISYSPPELFNRKRSLQSDIWSVGVILQKMLTGKMPFEGESEMALMFSIIQDEPKPLPNEIPQLYRNLISKCLQKDTKDRFQTAREMREALKNPQQSNLEKERLQREKEEQQRLERERLQDEAEAKRIQLEKEENLRKQKEVNDALQQQQKEEKQKGEAEIEKQKELKRNRLKDEEAKRQEEIKLHNQEEGKRHSNSNKAFATNLSASEVKGMGLYCPKCRSSYEMGSTRFCYKDGVRLIPIGSQPPSVNKDGGIFERLLNKPIFSISPELNKPIFSISPEFDKDANISILSRSQTFTNSIGMEFVKIPAGSFMMGSNNGESNEKPVHKVTISTDFYMGKYEVTQAQWQAVMGSNPSKFKGDNLPVERVSWEEAQEFIKKLNAKGEGTYRLPTEAEWEYAARAGTTGDYYGNLDSIAWYIGNSDNKTHPVGQKQANAVGLYDMSGNVWEWCQDWLGEYPSGAVTDPTGASSGSNRVFRGGGCGSDAVDLRSAARGGISPSSRYANLGFRVVRY